MRACALNHPPPTFSMQLVGGHTAHCAYENCLCQGGTEQRQTNQSDIAQRITYHQRIPKLAVGVACVVCVVSHRLGS